MHRERNTHSIIWSARVADNRGVRRLIAGRERPRCGRRTDNTEKFPPPYVPQAEDEAS
jgi:hypothetical protein